MDILNPFDPAAVDKEYKLGDDMLYGQFLRDNGDDLQGVAVFRRNLETGDVDADWSSFALKYHGLSGAGEFDLLAALHFDDPLVAGGGNLAFGARCGGGTSSSPSPTTRPWSPRSPASATPGCGAAGT